MKDTEKTYLLQLEHYVRKYMKTDGDVSELGRGIRATLHQLNIIRSAKKAKEKT